VGDDSFQSYAKNSNEAKVNFANYNKSFNIGTDTNNLGTAKGSRGHTVGFKIYGMNTTFKDYSKKGITFSRYTNVV
jgi:hypothetical protein